MKHIINVLLRFFPTLRPLKNLLSAKYGFYVDLNTLKRQMPSSGSDFPFGKLYPCLWDRYSTNGETDNHYFHQDLLVARRIHHNKPTKHVDVGSRIDGFLAHVASFRQIEVIDIRPQPNKITNVCFLQADLMSPLPEALIEYCDSLSCLHALEHFGLGRYGDPINFNGHLLGLDNLHSMLNRGGKIYLSVPIGHQRIEFNAHRVFSLAYLLKCFQRKFIVNHFSYVDDRGVLHEHIPWSDKDSLNSFGCNFGCGIFELTKS